MHKSYSRIGTNENDMKIRIRTARNHCQDVDNCGDEDHCQYHLGIDHCRTGNRCQVREHVRMEMSMQIDDQDQWFALKYN